MQQHFKNFIMLKNEINEYFDMIVEDEKIVYLGPPTESKTDEIVVDLNGKLLLPSFVNSNSNSYLAPLVFNCRDEYIDSLQSNEIQFDFNEDEIEILVKYHLAKNIQSGVTYIDDNSIYPKIVASLLKEYKLNGRVNYFSDDCDEYIKQVFRCDLKMDDNKLCELSDISGQKKLSISIKLCETLDEAGEIDKKFNKTSIGYVEELGLLDRGATLFGCNFIEKDDIEILRSYDCNIVVSNFSNLYLARGMPNIVNLISNDINVSLGSEYNTEVDMFEEMKNCYLLTRNLLCDYSLLSPEEIFELITDSAKSSMGFSGEIKVGDKASFIVLKNQEKIIDFDSFYKELLLKFNKTDVYMTVSNGKILYENDKFNIFDFEEIQKKYNEILRRKLWKFMKF